MVVDVDTCCTEKVLVEAHVDLFHQALHALWRVALGQGGQNLVIALVPVIDVLLNAGLAIFDHWSVAWVDRVRFYVEDLFQRVHVIEQVLKLGRSFAKNAIAGKESILLWHVKRQVVLAVPRREYGP